MAHTELFKDPLAGFLLGVIPLYVLFLALAFGIFISIMIIGGRILWIFRPLIFLVIKVWWFALYLFAIGLIVTGILAFFGYTKPIAWVLIAMVTYLFMWPMQLIGAIFGIAV